MHCKISTKKYNSYTFSIISGKFVNACVMSLVYVDYMHIPENTIIWYY